MSRPKRHGCCHGSIIVRLWLQYPGITSVYRCNNCHALSKVCFCCIFPSACKHVMYTSYRHTKTLQLLGTSNHDTSHVLRSVGRKATGSAGSCIEEHGTVSLNIHAHALCQLQHCCTNVAIMYSLNCTHHTATITNTDQCLMSW